MRLQREGGGAPCQPLPSQAAHPGFKLNLASAHRPREGRISFQERSSLYIASRGRRVLFPVATKTSSYDPILVLLLAYCPLALLSLSHKFRAQPCLRDGADSTIGVQLFPTVASSKVMIDCHKASHAACPGRTLPLPASLYAISGDSVARTVCCAL